MTLGGYVAFNLPRTVTLIGTALLGGLIATHAYVVLASPAVPVWFAVYTAAVTVGCLLAAAIMWLDLGSRVPQLGWLLGSLVCLAFLAAYLASRIISLSGLIAVTGRWDFAPGTIALACAGAFVAVHISVLLGINVAFGQRRDWHD